MVAVLSPMAGRGHDAPPLIDRSSETGCKTDAPAAEHHGALAVTDAINASWLAIQAKLNGVTAAEISVRTSSNRLALQ